MIEPLEGVFCLINLSKGWHASSTYAPVAEYLNLNFSTYV